MSIQWYDKDSIQDLVKEKVASAEILLDIGCGIMPQNYTVPLIHICCEPFQQYFEQLSKKIDTEIQGTFIVLQKSWKDIVEKLPPQSVDTVFLLDIIEHLDKEEGRRLLKLTEQIAKKQIVIFTPIGFMPQKHEGPADAWGLCGGAFQEHKSGWIPDEDFDSSWNIYACENYHNTDNLGKTLDKPFGAFWAIKNITGLEENGKEENVFEDINNVLNAIDVVPLDIEKFLFNVLDRTASAVRQVKTEEENRRFYIDATNRLNREMLLLNNEMLVLNKEYQYVRDYPRDESCKLPLVTIITPAYNRANFLDETIQSVLTQDYPYIEYIILDDGSTDNTREILEKYQCKLFWESHANMGETRTVNKGIGLAKGDIICIVNSDDPILPGLVSTAVKYMNNNPNALVVYPDWKEIGSSSEFIKEVRLPQYELLSMLTEFNVGMGPGTFIRRRAFECAGMRDTQFRYAGDLEYWFRLAIYGSMVHIPEVLATHRSHSDSASVSGRGAEMSGELIRMLKKVYSFPNLPSEVYERRHNVFGLAHHEAVHYCGSSHISALKHYLMAYWHDYSLFSWNDVKAFLKRLLKKNHTMQSNKSPLKEK